MNEELDRLLTETELINTPVEIKLYTELTLQTGDVLNTYGHTSRTEFVIKTKQTRCKHCNLAPEKSEKYCLGNGIHNFKKRPQVLISTSAPTPDEAIKNALDALKLKSKNVLSRPNAAMQLFKVAS